MYFGEKKGFRKAIKKVRDAGFRGKGAGLRDQYSALPFKTL